MVCVTQVAHRFVAIGCTNRIVLSVAGAAAADIVARGRKECNMKLVNSVHTTRHFCTFYYNVSLEHSTRHGQTT